MSTPNVPRGQEPPASEGIDFLKRLPSEVASQVLNLLKPKEWRELRLVSRQWNQRCQKLVWRRVLIGSYNQLRIKEMDDQNNEVNAMLEDISVLFGDGFESCLRQWKRILCGYFDPLSLTDFEHLKASSSLPSSQMLLSYQQLVKEGSNPLFRESIKNVSELWMIYGSESPAEAERSFAIMAELFKHVPKIGVNYYEGPSDKKFKVFQAMLNQWKPTAEFSLRVFMNPLKGEGNYACLDINGMNITGLFLTDDHCSDDKDQVQDKVVPLTWGNGNTARWSELSSLSPNLHTLTLDICDNVFQHLAIPETIKYLRLTNHGDKPIPRTGPKLKIPGGLEYFAFADMAVREVYDDNVAFLECLDLTAVTQLKSFRYEGKFCRELVQVVEVLCSSVEELVIGCTIAPCCTEKMRELAKASCGIKVLRLIISGLDFTDLRLRSLLSNSKFVEQMEEKKMIDDGPLFEDEDGEVITLEGLREKLGPHPRAMIFEYVVAEFVHGCKSMKRMEVSVDIEMEWAEKTPWLYRCEGETYEVDIAKSRPLLEAIAEAPAGFTKFM